MTESRKRASIEDVLAEFDAKEDLLLAFCAKTKSLIEASLQDANIRYQSVQARVKTKKKLKEKYLDERKNYQRLDDITDLSGLRVITYYDDDVDRVAELIRREFKIDHKNSVDKRHTEPDRFGYSALNYVCRHLEKRIADVEYKKFAGICCEIQVVSILSHAWSEIEHEWYDLKEAYPHDIKRKFSRLAALLDLAESEFLSIRASRTQYERSVAVRVGANVPDLPVDAVSLKSFVEQEPLVAEIDKALALALGTNVSGKHPVSFLEMAVRVAGMTKLQDVRDSLKRYRTAIPEFVRRMRQKEVWPAPTAGMTVPMGTSIYQLATILVSLRGTEATVRFCNALEMTPSWSITRQVAIAQEITAEYNGGSV